MRSATRNKVGRDAAYLEWLHTLGCIVCREQWRKSSGYEGSLSQFQSTPTEAAHIGQIRGLSQKCPDREAAPLCARHYRTGCDSHHVIGKRFWQHHGLDRARVISELNAAYENQQVTA